jgi:CO/xanthine dehydrogenase FAD-binding subunit
MAPTIRRCPALERQFGDGPRITAPDDLLPAIARDVSPIDDIRSTAEYRRRVMARVLYFGLQAS